MRARRRAFRGHAACTPIGIAAHAVKRPLCLNVVSDSSTLSEHEGALVPVNSCDVGALVPASRATVMRTLRHLEGQRGTMGKSDFEREQMIYGWCDPLGNLMLDPALAEHVEIAKNLCFDWAHIFLVNGIFNVHFGLFMKALRPRVGYAGFAEFCGAMDLAVANACQVGHWDHVATGPAGEELMEERRVARGRIGGIVFIPCIGCLRAPGSSGEDRPRC